MTSCLIAGQTESAEGNDVVSPFKDSVALITGAASGLGELLARRLVRLQARVVLGDRNFVGVERVASELRQQGGDAVAFACDVTQEVDAANLVTEAITRWGRLDIAVNNAGMSPPMKALIDTTEADFDVAIAVNAKGTFFGMKHQLAAMQQRKTGVILNVASAAGIGAAPKLAAYSAAKHAVVGLTKTAAVEYARMGIRVNAICPFYTVTPMVTDSEISERMTFLANASPMKRLGAPEEIVEMMLSLCSPRNSYMTGQAVSVDGGVSAI
ncbi:glucose 1-dehydrogenase [Comamonas aquatica]|uniref:SDR family NAD(P)-dependent oxidoreductase n=1 Tax=Comamonas aquatica TaxID=225991 RepID=UPI0028D2FD08|nr:glucose 1-dehydrogenase [Comamonas aquatica]